MIWDVMGDEGDGYLTLMSSYSLGTGEYLESGIGASNITGYLNGAFLNNSFSAAERKSVPSFDVTTGRYSQDGTLIGETVAAGQRVYLPWGIYNDAGTELANSVFWTAGKLILNVIIIFAL